MKYYAIADVRSAAQGRWPQILGDFGAKSEHLDGRHRPCPGCGGRDRFRFDDLGGDGTFMCSQGSGDLLVGDGIKLLGHIKQWDWKQCIQELGDHLGLDARVGVPRRDEGVERPAPEPTAAVDKRPEIDPYMVWEFTRGVPESIDEAWLRRRSPVDVVGLTSGQYLDHLYAPGECVVIFNEVTSKGTPWTQGDFLWCVGKGGFRLAKDRGTKAVRSVLPTEGAEGVWYLTQPVTGLWATVPLKTWLPKEKRFEVTAKWTRRSYVNVTSWRHFVLETDTLDWGEWIRVLAALEMPIVAIYTSGGRSIHALVRWPLASKAEWDVVRDGIKQLICPLGGCPGALSAVRLSRLPGCVRKSKGNVQELLYLNPAGDKLPIMLRPEVRP